MNRKFLKKFAFCTAIAAALLSPSYTADAADININVGGRYVLRFDTADGSKADDVQSLSPDIISVSRTEEGIILSGLSEGIGKLKVKSGKMFYTYDAAVKFDTSSGFLDGDVNNDGRADVKDIDILQKYFTKKAPVIMNFSAGDMNHDGKINIFDIVYFKRLITEDRAPRVTEVTTTAVTTTTTTTTTTVTTAAAPVKTTSADEAELSRAVEMLSYMNEERAARGAAPLKINPTLCAAANKRAEEIVKLFSHQRPDGTKCFTVLGEYGLNYYYCGENIAAGHPDVKGTYEQWKASEGHYENMVSTDYTEYGLGYFHDPNSEYRYYWVQLFRAPRT